MPTVMLAKIRALINKPRNAIPFLFVLLGLLVLLVLPVGAGGINLLDSSGYDWKDDDPNYCNTTPVIGMTYTHEAMNTSFINGVQVAERWCQEDNGAFLFSNVCTLYWGDAGLEVRENELCMIDLTTPGCETELPDGQFQIDLSKCELNVLWQLI